MRSVLLREAVEDLSGRGSVASRGQEPPGEFLSSEAGSSPSSCRRASWLGCPAVRTTFSTVLVQEAQETLVAQGRT